MLLPPERHDKAPNPGPQSRHVTDDGRDVVLAVHAYRVDGLVSKARDSDFSHSGDWLSHDYRRQGGQRGSSSWLGAAPLLPRWIIDGVRWWNIGCRWVSTPLWEKRNKQKTFLSSLSSCEHKYAYEAGGCSRWGEGAGAAAPFPGKKQRKTTWFSGKQCRKYSGKRLQPPPYPPNKTGLLRLCISVRDKCTFFRHGKNRWTIPPPPPPPTNLVSYAYAQRVNLMNTWCGFWFQSSQKLSDDWWKITQTQLNARTQVMMQFSSMDTKIRSIYTSANVLLELVSLTNMNTCCSL